MDASFNLIIAKLSDSFLSYVVITARFFGAMSIFPLLQASYFSKMLKILLSFSFSIVIFPSINTEAINTAHIMIKCFFIFKEYFLGFVIGFILSIPIWVITGAGKFIDNQRGESMGSLLSPMSKTPSSSTGNLLVNSFGAYFVSMNGLIFFVGILYKSFRVYPANEFLPVIAPQMIDHYIDLFTSMCYWIVLLAMPVVVTMFIVEVILGLLSTFLPQLNVTILAMPIKSCVGIFILILYMHNLYEFTIGHFLDKIKGVYV